MALQRSVFRDESVLFPEFLPHSTPHRVDQFRALELYFQSVVQNASHASQNVLLCGPVGCHRKGQLVLMLDGSLKRVEDVAQGDLLMGPDSAPRKVLETVHGFGQMIEVLPIKGKPFVVSEDHILTVIQTRLKKHPRKPSEDTEGIIKDIRVSELLSHPRWKVGPKGLYKLIRTGVDFPRMSAGPIDPYFLGVYLGDGSSANGTIAITSADAEISNVVNNQSGKYLLKVRQYPAGQAQEYVLTLGRTGGQTLLNGLAKDLIELGLYKKTSESKFIPSQYKFGSRRIRLEVLAGLLDTDGSLDAGYFDFMTKSKQLAEDVAFVSRSLGFYAFVMEKSSHDQFGHEGLYYRVGISGDISKILTRVSRKQAQTRRQKKSVLRTGFTLKPLGEEEYFGFRVDSDQRYLLDDFTITHNSGKTMLAKKLGETLQKKAVLYGNIVKLFHVNCRIDRTLQAIFVKALNTLGHEYPSRGYSSEELLQTLLEELKGDRVHLIIAFDEVDSLVSSDPSSLYTITRLRELSQSSQVFSSLLISKTLDYLKMVDLSTLSSIQWNTVTLDPYSEDQLYDILESRTGDAFNDGVVGEDCLEMAAGIASTYGDARYALDLIYRAGKMADLSGSPRVSPEYVRHAKASLPPQFRKEELSYLTKHQRIILMAISNLFKNNSSAYVTIGEVEKGYNAQCETMGFNANHHTQLWNDVNELSRKGIIETQLSGKGLKGRTTLISLSLVSAKDLIGELEKGMVADARS
ncbi:MAG: AAA family ATPase [Thaumarchaeota archaeon]|nr:AAA family ATPase [Nitrososphaerota archaeon]